MTRQFYSREMKTYIYTKNLYMNIHSNVIHNYQNLEKQQMFFIGCMGKPLFIHIMEYYLIMKKEWTIYVYSNLDES